MLRISKDLSLPDEAVTQTFAILAKRGVGKTYTASVMVEEMLKNRLHVVVVDPIGVWWGLRTSASGKKAGLSIIVAGGEHGDVPLDPNSGELVANLVVDKKLSVVIDISLMRKGEQKRFMIDFAETLYRANRQALHLVLDEADEFAPQRPMGDDARMLGAIEDIVRRGRARGIGVTLITQRPAVLNKNVLTQIEVLIAMRLTSPQDRQAINEWVKYHADTESSTEMITSLPQLPIGTGWFWSPGWLDIFKKVAIRTRETLDSSSTPKVGQQAIKPTKVAKVDLEELKKHLATTIEKAAAEDPKLLHRRIIELERQLKSQKPETIITQVQVLPAGLTEQLDVIERSSAVYASTLQQLRDFCKKFAPADSNPIIAAPTNKRIADVPRPAKPAPMPASNNGDEKKIFGGAQRMLDVLGSRYPMTFTRSQLAALSKMSPRSGTFGTYMALLRSQELINQIDGQISLTAKGQQHVSRVTNVPQTTEEVIDMWRDNLYGGAKRIFNVLIEHYPRTLSKSDLGNAAEISPSSGTFGTYMSMLRRNGLIEVNGGMVRASDNLFVGEATNAKK